MNSQNNAIAVKIVNVNAAQVSTPRHDDVIMSVAQSQSHSESKLHRPMHAHTHAHTHTDAHTDALQGQCLEPKIAPLHQLLPHAALVMNTHNDTIQPMNAKSSANANTNGIGQPRDTDTDTPLPIPTRPLHLNVTTDECSSPFTSQNASPNHNNAMVIKTDISPRQVSASCSSSSAESHAKVQSQLHSHSQSTHIQQQSQSQSQSQLTSLNGFTSADSATPLALSINANVHANINANTNDAESSSKTSAMTHRDADEDGDDLCPNVPLSFTVDVASALDHVLNELDKDEQEQTKANANANAYPSRIRHGDMPLDSSSFESNYGGIRHGIVNDHGGGDQSGHHDYDHHHRSSTGSRPCVLQQTSVVDIGSGATSPSGGASVGGNSKSSNETGSVSAEEKAGVSVKSSMLVCEESLNLIAQMTAPPKQGQKFQAQSGTESSLQPAKTSSDNAAMTVTTPIASNLTSASPLLPTASKKVASKTSKIKGILENATGARRKAPLITGTAAAQFEAMNRKNGTNNSPLLVTANTTTRALVPPPQLIPGKVSIISSAAGDRNETEAVIVNAKADSDTSGDENCDDSGNGNENENGASDKKQVKKTEKGMDMLADIISHAAPILSGTGATAAVNAGEEGQCMVPIGQSLSVYTAIAAKAGVTTHPPLPLPTLQPQIQFVQKLEQQQVHDQEQAQLQPQVLEQQQVRQTYIREIGKIRRFCAATGEFSEWEDLPCQTYGDTEPRRWCELNIDESIEIPLRRGGRLRVFPNFVSDGRRDRVSHSMDQCTLYRQYRGQGNEDSVEARIQVLLSSKTNRTHNSSSKRGKPGYIYDGVTMMAQPLAQVPEVERLGRDLAELYRLPGKEWNIGANLVCYRTGEDHMAWNSNCEQGEVLILCIIAESQNCTRPILIRPKGHYPLQDGDEEIIVFVGQGDAYEMDGQMQLSYEHCMPKKEDDMSAKRSVVVFRHGRSVPVTFDTGTPLFTEEKNSNANVKTPTINFGHPAREIPEGKGVFLKQQLLDAGAHLHERKNVNGTGKEGCDSILVENQDPSMREDDGLCWLQVTSAKSDGGAALCQSYASKLPVRVFRSSTLESRYAPSLYADEADKVLYRYDGLYVVRAMWDSQGNETDNPPPNNVSKHTFFLMRYPKKPVDGNFEDGMHYNKVSIHELWNEIQKRSGVRTPRLFQVPQPFMELAPIGDKSNLSRRRKENIKLPSEENLKSRRARRRRKSASSPEGSVSDSQPRQLSSTRCLPMPKKNSSATGLESENDICISNNSHHCENDSDAGSLRPKRKSATAARSYLQEAMQTKNGVGEKSRDRKRRPSIHLPDVSHSKRIKDESHLDDDSSIDAKSITSDGDHTAIESDKILLSPGDNAAHNELVIVAIDETSPSSRKSEVEAADPPEKAPAKRAYKRKNAVKSELENLDTEPEPKVGKVGFNPASIQVGYRVNVEYRDVLYKATVRRVRLKQKIYQYHIHYDGNKKTNLRWIPSTMVHDVISTIVEEEIDTKPVAKRRKPVKEESESEAMKVEEAVEVDEPVVKEVVEDRKYRVGSEVYVEYRKVLYIATIRKTRLNRKKNCEYLVHYDGFKKTSDRWVKEGILYEINDESTHRFNEQRGELPEPVVEVKKLARARRSGSMDLPFSDGTRRTRGRYVASVSSTNESADAPTLDMGEFDSGVEFLPGSCVFVVRKDALYLAKMVKRKKIGKGMEYLVHFEGSTPNHDTWVPLHSVYEINPKTRRIFDGTADKRDNLNDDDNEEVDEEEDIAHEEDEKKKSAPVPPASPTRASTRRNARKPAKYHNDEDVEEREEKPTKKTGRTKKGRKSEPTVALKPVDMSGIDSGCDFLPGSTIFVIWKNGLYLGKMLKKRGRRENMEYFVHYDGFGQSQDAWVSVSLVYEINPQTKRAFNKQKKK